MVNDSVIERPDSPAMADLVAELARRADELDASGRWPGEEIALCAQAGVFRWFVPTDQGGLGWSYPDVVRGLIELSRGSLAVAFTLTQQTTTLKWLLGTPNEALRRSILPELLEGSLFASTGLAQLTTSRQHTGKPALVATPVDGGYRFDGFCPWATGASRADELVTGAVLDDGRQMLALVPTNSPGLAPGEPVQLMALSATHTGSVKFDGVFVPDRRVLHAPCENVMAMRSTGGTGSLETSALALGLAGAAIDFLEAQAERRSEFDRPAESLADDHANTVADLLAMAAGEPSCSKDELRRRANSLAVRASQASLVAAKGAGFVVGHPTGRFCRESLFFLVWSCPAPVAAAQLCEFAGLGLET